MNMRNGVVRIRSHEGAEFTGYLAVPRHAATVPAVVLASTVRGGGGDLRSLADGFACQGYIAMAPGLFWRATAPPPSRSEQIRRGERDMADALASLLAMPGFNGRALAMGFCYGGPYAILGPKRLGFSAGLSCHGTRMLDYIGELEGLAHPVSVLWGDRDHLAPSEVLEAYRLATIRFPNVDTCIFPGVRHGYMMRGKAEAFDAQARDFSMARALRLLDGLRS